VDSSPETPGFAADFRIRSTLGVALSALFLLTPFSLNNIFQGRLVLGFGSLVIVIILGISAWHCHHGRYRPRLMFVVLVPAIILFITVAIRELGVTGVLWCYPAVLAFYVMLPERQAWISNLTLLLVNLPQAWMVLDHSLAARVMATLVMVSTFSAIFVRVISNQQRRLEEQSLTDSLTGLFNRTQLRATLEHAIQQSHRTGMPMTILTLDLDHFKKINDGLGHDAGDTVLRGLGEFLNKRIRRADRVFRLGGEEFMILLFSTDLENGRGFADELREEIAALKLLDDRAVTTSIGVASLRAEDDWKAWMKRSDQNLYRAKAEGRNRVVA